MERRETYHILRNFPDLIAATESTKLMFHLKFEKVLTEEDEAHILSRQTPMEQAAQLYNIVQSRKNAYEILKKALKKTHQTGAYSILEKFNAEESWRKVGKIEYDRNTLLGLGSDTTKVFRGRLEHNVSVTVKKIHCNKYVQDKILEQVEVLRNLDTHINIVQLLHVEVNRADNFLLIAAEFCSWTLKECVRLQQYPIEKPEILKQTACGLNYLHTNKIIHGDLKPSNVLIASDDSRSGLVKLSDCAVARLVEDRTNGIMATRKDGSGNWKPPESLMAYVGVDEGRIPKLQVITGASDIFSLGLLYYHILTDGGLAFGGFPLYEHNVLQGNYNLMKLQSMPEESKFCKIIECMISTKPSSRPISTDVVDGLHILESTSDTVRNTDIPDTAKLDMIRSLHPFKVKVFLPQKKLRHIDDHYKLPTHYKGQALILNIIEFDEHVTLSERKGAVNDTVYMQDLWKALGFEVTIHAGKLTKFDVLKAIADFTEYIHEDDELTACVVYIGSHGEHGKVFTSEGDYLNPYSDIIYKIAKLDSLKGKPKFYIVNACQNFSRTEHDASHLKMKVEDAIICFSTLPGERSNRDIYMGSWYVNCLTLVFMENAFKKDLESLLFLTQDTMRYILTNDTAHGQQPYHQNFFMKKLYFNTNWKKTQ